MFDTGRMQAAMQFRRPQPMAARQLIKVCQGGFSFVDDKLATGVTTGFL